MDQRAYLETAAMLNGFPLSAGNPDVTMASIEAELEHVTSQAIIEAALAFRGGHVPGQNLDFPPSVPRFCAEVRRIEAEHRFAARPALPAPEPDAWDRAPASERARMRLKMPMLQHAHGTPRIHALHALVARRAPFEDYIALAQSWGMMIPPEAWDEYEREQRHGSQHPRSRNPIPCEVRAERLKRENAHLPVLAEGLSWDQFRSQRWPDGAKWVAALATVYGPEGRVG